MAHPLAGERARIAAAESALRSFRRTAMLHAGSMTALLVLLILVIFVIPASIDAGGRVELINDVSFTLVLLAGAAAVVERRTLPLAAAILCVVAIVGRWSEWVLPAGVSILAREGSSLMALILLTAIVVRRVFGSGTVTTDRIIGAVVLYLLLGFAWAVAYELAAAHVPEAFSSVGTGRGPARWFYFSFVTLTTVGYGDITPTARITQSLATLEALVGQLYPAIILARLVSLHIAPERENGT